MSQLDNDNPNVDLGKVFSICLFVLSISFFYALIRYNIVRELPLSSVPIFITNKAIALSATILIGFSFILGPLARFFPAVFGPSVKTRKYYGVGGFWLATAHALMSLAILSPAYYPRLFLASGKLTGIGESMLLMGILALIIFALISLTSIPSVGSNMAPTMWQTVQRLGYLAYVFILVHVFVIGYRGWLQPESWQFGLASISLIAATFIVLVLLVRIIVSALPPRIDPSRSQ